MDAPTLVGLAAALIVLGIVFRLLEFSRPKSQRLPLIRPGLKTDLAYWFVFPFIHHYVVGAVVLATVIGFAFAAYGRIDKDQIMMGFGPLAQLPAAVQALLMLVIADFLGYWTHRLFHRRRLWPFHAIHHSSTTLDWLSSIRQHPVNDLISRIATTLPLLALGFSPAAALWIAPVFAVFALLLHANLDWDWGRLRTVIASPRFHRWHHSEDPQARDKNFAGLFPIFDIVFGTYYMPKDRLPANFGTATPVPEGLWAQLSYPFRNTKNAGR